jgi:hypothetical protein
MMLSVPSSRLANPLAVCLLLVVATVLASLQPAYAIEATWNAGVQTLVFDINCVPGQIACGDRDGSPPDSPVVDLSVSTTRIVSNVTHFALASLTAFVDVGDALLVSGVAQSDALRTPALPVPGCCMVGGEATLGLTFDATTVPLAVDIFMIAHRVGPYWGNLIGPGGIDFSGSGLFVHMPTTVNDGDVSLEYHTILAPNSGKYGLSVLAAAFLNNTTPTPTAETKVVWELRVTPVPWPATAVLVCVSLALMLQWRQRTHVPAAST